MAETNEALAAAGLKVKADQKIRHMVEVLIEDFGYEELGKHVKKPLDGIKIAGYVGCQTNRPFGIDGESFENPKYLDKLVETVGAEPLDNYDKKVSCCGGALAFSRAREEPGADQGHHRVRLRRRCRHDRHALPGLPDERRGLPGPDQRRSTRPSFKMPVVYYSTLMSVAYGKTGKEAGLDGQVIKAKQLEEIASK